MIVTIQRQHCSMCTTDNLVVWQAVCGCWTAACRLCGSTGVALCKDDEDHIDDFNYHGERC